MMIECQLPIDEIDFMDMSANQLADILISLKATHLIVYIQIQCSGLNPLTNNKAICPKGFKILNSVDVIDELRKFVTT